MSWNEQATRTAIVDAPYPKNTILQITADGTLTVATDATPAHLIAGSLRYATTKANQTATIVLPRGNGTREYIATEAIVDLTVPQKIAAAGKISAAGGGVNLCIPLHAASPGEHVETRVIL